jgi:hypothetical protein
VVGEHDGVIEWTGKALQAGRVSVCLVALRKAVRSFDRWGGRPQRHRCAMYGS